MNGMDFDGERDKDKEDFHLPRLHIFKRDKDTGDPALMCLKRLKNKTQQFIFLQDGHLREAREPIVPHIWLFSWTNRQKE
jgi:hypothetical protein